jgi:mannose/fructose/N-acetylgalactosamine-specific phosphotransferase system component IID
MLPLWRAELRLPVPAAGPLAIAVGGLAITLGMVALLRAGGTPAKLMLGLAAACVVLASLGVV